ncbi:MAG: ATP-binding protein [Nitrospira sp. SB0667_bin_9]|nr:ATP-binding protein [Nitrospira sp. SB0667_bin_9]MYD31827.1 ATP-binding protein [Nitrospira sp. SB0661_bin_20]
MNFKVEIKNIGKLADSELRIGRFTVFAGPNNTGKSFVSKLLYSLFDAMNANPAETYMDHLVSPAENALVMMQPWVRDGSIQARLIGAMLPEFYRLKDITRGASIDELDQMIPKLISQTEKMQEMTASISGSFESEDEQKGSSSLVDKPPPFQERSWKTVALENMKRSLAELQKTLNQANAKKFIVAGMQYKIRENLIQNFQVTKISDLRGDGNTSSKVSVEDFGSFEFSNGEIRFDTYISGIKQLQRYSRIFL